MPHAAGPHSQQSRSHSQQSRSHSHAHSHAQDPREYDASVRRLVPGYEEALAALAGALKVFLRDRPADVLDLGAGTGALSERILAAVPNARVTVLDADEAMLVHARERLAAHAARTAFVHGSFTDALPACDAAVASLSLHHVHSRKDKRALYRNIRRALRPRGLLLSFDTFVADAAAFAAEQRRRIAEALAARGATDEQVRARLAAWAREVRYFSADEELGWMREAGFAEAGVIFRRGSLAVACALAS